MNFRTRMLLSFALILAGVVAVLLFIASRQSDYVTVTRSATLAAPAPALFAQVNDFHKWQAWSPWAKRDPAAKNSFSGPESGPGAGFAWDGNRQVGAGSMTITESTAPEHIRLQLDFLRPIKGTNQTDFTFQPQGEKTLVTWTMTGQRNLLMKTFGLFLDCDKMVGPDFEQGLANLGEVCAR